MSEVKLNIAFACFTLKKFQVESIIRRCIHAALDAENITAPCEINVLVTDDNGIRAINSETRKIDEATDVLSFPMFPLNPGDPPKNWEPYLDPETGLCPLGDMVISLERAIRQADSFGHSMRREVGYLTIHSVLHLLGYDHLDEGEQKAQMREREELIAGNIRGMRRA